MRWHGFLFGAAVVAVAGVAAPAWGQEESVSQVLDKIETSLREMERLLDGVKDKASADAAAVPLEKIKESLQVLKTSQYLDGERVPVPDAKDVPALERRIEAIDRLNKDILLKVALLDGKMYYDSQALLELLQPLVPVAPPADKAEEKPAAVSEKDA